MFSLTTVVEQGNKITISYVHRHIIQKDIERVFGTSRINRHMFIQSGRFSFTLYSFFALELYHVIDILLESDERLRTSRRTLKSIKEGLLKNTWLRNLEKDFPSRLDFSQLKKFHFTPLDYQRSFMDSYNLTLPRYNLNGMLLAADPGTGKTFTTLAVAECLHSEVIIIVCPKPALQRVWVTSIENDIAEGGLYKTPQVCWDSEKKTPYANERHIVIHYEGLPYLLNLVPILKGKKITIILDESHNLNEIKSLRTLRFIEICHLLESKDIIFATGTPLKALSVETIPLLKAIDPLFTDRVLEIFKKMFSGEIQATTDVLRRRYNIVSYKVSKSVINLQEPIQETINITVPHGERFTLAVIADEMRAFNEKRTLELEKELPAAKAFFYSQLDYCEGIISITGSKKEIEALHEYRNALAAVVKAYERGNLYVVNDEMRYCSQYEKNVIIPMLRNKQDKERFIHCKTLVKYLKLKVRGECLGQILLKKRIEAFKSLVRYIDFESFIESGEKKTVVFTTYVDIAEEAVRRLKELEYSPLSVYGEQTKDLANIVSRFDKEDEINPLVATYASLSTAVPLIMADTMVIINPPFRQYIMDQAIARIHRLGADTQTRIFHMNLVTGEEPNICSRTIDIMKWSKEQVDYITGVSVNDETTDDTSISTEEYLYFNRPDIPNKEKSILESW